jgi:hypothetical protein
MINNWRADLKKMTCENASNRIVVTFTDMGKFLDGKIDDMPADLFFRLADPAYLGRQISEAEDVFIPAFIKEQVTSSR